MVVRVPAAQIETLVGKERHRTLHFARAESSARVIHLMHSHECWDESRPLIECPFALAQARGIDERMWLLHEDKTVQAAIDLNGHLVPAGTELA